MSEKKDKSSFSKNDTENDKDVNKEGYPLYPESEDIYEKYKERREVDPADTSKSKESSDTNVLRQEALDKKHKISGRDLDIPGSELDDAQEDIGNEDEENNYYSLGGDDHDDLEEDKG